MNLCGPTNLQKAYDFPVVSVNSVGPIVRALGVFGAESGQLANSRATTVLDQSTRNDFKSASDRLVRPLTNTFDGLAVLVESLKKRNLNRKQVGWNLHERVPFPKRPLQAQHEDSTRHCVHS